MANKLMKGLLATAVVAALAGCNSDDKDPVAEVCGADNCTKFTILHTNDNHGRFWENSDGEYGMAARKTLIERLRSEVESNGGQTLLLSGGDINTGVPESDLQDAEPDFIGMNLIGYDAMAVGNHEFDNPLSVLDMQRELAEFPMLAANIYKKDGTRYFEPYKVFDVKGLKVAVIGLTTEDTHKIGNPEVVGELKFTDPKEEIKKVIKELNDNKVADIIVATTHMGHYADAQNGSNAPGDVAMARALEEGKLQVIIGGHSQDPVCMEPGSQSYADFKPGDECLPDQQNGTWIMQAHEWGKYVGRADFEYYGGKLHLASYKLIPVNLRKLDAEGKKTEVLAGEPIPADTTVKAVLQQYQDKGSEKLGEIIATTDGKLEGDSDVVRGQQTNLGRLLAMAQASKVNADIGVMNSGGVRDSIAAGDISYRQVLTVQPFGNMITLSTMTGAELSDYLGVVATMQRGSGAYAQITGVKMTVDCQAKSVAISEVNGKDYSATDSYTFTVPGFNAAGGDGYPKLDPVQTGYVDAEVFYSFLKEKKSITAADYAPVGDIVYENSNSPLGCEVPQ
ncbi:bifunctional UDP-sugar hydrolase/5'-nucleotidase UshA [Shewanella carassii]|uniref:Bifunctional metallophosphatase/5'-nucleotidase n=1 Tax=Shewanella carassii TaxID=1987584 RepID=A0ABQ1SY37_9GAMM|nr:bifunctional UDP-sugar hydrolase/5'-nucleotidase UshA [Shewanella carassii]GGE67773.1 bifunctional metallophosphatase/5'-nucleotidase [Shewanella carassii]